MKRKIGMFLLSLAVFFSLGLFLTACDDNGGGGGGQEVQQNIYIAVDGQVSLSDGYIEQLYNEYTSFSTLRDRVTFYRGSIGNYNLMSDSSITSFDTYYYSSLGYTEQGAHLGWAQLTDVDVNATLNAGEYKVVYDVNNVSLELHVRINKLARYNKSVKIAIVSNSETNYADHYQQSSYNYGMPEYSDSYSADTYTSEVKAYVYDPEKNEVVSGTKVTRVYAIVQTAPADYTFEWIDYLQGSFTVNAGDNLVDKYYEITAQDASNNTDDYILESRRNEYLSHYGANSGTEITTGKVRDDNTLVVYTEGLRPGDYYTFAYYSDDNHEGVYTTLSKNSCLHVDKGVYSLKKSIYRDGYAYSATEAQSLLDNLVLTAQYSFSLSDSKFNNNTSKALTIADLSDIQIGEDTSAYSQCLLSQSGSRGGVTGWGRFVLNGKDVNGDIVEGLDASDSGIVLQAVYFLEDPDDYTNTAYADECYENDPTIYYVTVTINPCQVERPYINNASELNKEYTGSVIDLGLVVPSPAVVVLTGDTSATNINNYSVSYSLKDDVNYYFKDKDSSYYYGDDYDTFNWNITKISFSADNFVLTVTYDDSELPDNTITYTGEKTFRMHLSNPEYDTAKTYGSASMVWEIDFDNTFNIINPTIEADGDDILVSFDGSDNIFGYITFTCTIAATDISNKIILEYIQTSIYKAEFTDAQWEEICSELGITPSYDDNDNREFSKPADINVSRLDMQIPASAIPTANTGLGAWVLCYVDNDSEIEVHVGDTITMDMYGWHYKFAPADDMFVGCDDLVVEVQFYCVDVPAAVVNKLKSEVTFTDQFVATGDWATITLYNESNTQAYVPMNTLPTHDAGDEDLSQGELAGTWALRCDTHDSGNNPYTLDLGNNQIIYYDDVYSREFLESADRNWRLVFIPDNAAYNDVEISVNIQIV